MVVDTKSFIYESIQTFGDKFKYDKTNYVNAKRSVIIYCTEHEYDVTILPNSHLKSKDGCNSECKLHGQGLKRKTEYERCQKDGVTYKKHRCSRCKGEMNDFFKNVHDECMIKIKEQYIRREQKKKETIKNNVISNNNAKEISNEKQEINTEKIESKDDEIANSICEYINNKGKHCTFKQNKSKRWCGKHRRKGYIEEQINNGIKYCSNWVRGCDTILTDFVWNTCLQCREKDRVDDKKRRENKKSTPDLDVKSLLGLKHCIGCDKDKSKRGFNTLDGKESTYCEDCLKKSSEHDNIPQSSQYLDINSLLGLKHCTGCNKYKYKKGFKTLNGKESTRCEDCLKISREREQNRPKRDRDYKEYDVRPERKERKKEWNAANKDKTVFYYKDYRNRERQKDPIAYLDKNAKVQRDWRNNNSEQAKTNDERWKQSNNYSISYYKSSANAKGVSFEISDEYIIKCIHSKCWYCGMSSDEVNMGIDRLDPDGPYSEENTRPCCSPCNYSKKDYTVPQYIGKIFDILAYTFPDCGIQRKEYVYDIKFPCTYTSSKSAAKDRQIDFELTEEEYMILTNSNNCYLCGYECEYGLGIDRINNDIHYIFSNCKPCCSMCNYIKKDSRLADFINRSIKIWINFKDYNTSQHLKVNQRGGSMNPRITQRNPDITIREKALIRNKLKNTNPKWMRASTNYIIGKADENDLKILNDVNIAVEAEIQRQRLQLINNMSNDTVKDILNEERKRKQREQKQKSRQKKSEIKKPRGRPKKEISDDERKRKQREKIQRYREKKKLDNLPKKMGRPKKEDK